MKENENTPEQKPAPAPQGLRFQIMIHGGKRWVSAVAVNHYEQQLEKAAIELGRLSGEVWRQHQLLLVFARGGDTAAKADAGVKLVALARAAWALADGTEGTEQTGPDGPFFCVPVDLWNTLSAHLDELDKLPEQPGYVSEGPAKAAFALGLSEVPPAAVKEGGAS